MKIPQYIFIHHTAVSWSKNSNQWQATENYHVSKGWGTGGYNYEVAADGSIHQFCEDGAVTTAQYQEDMNDGRALSICLDGNFDIEDPTKEQKDAVAAWLKDKMSKYNIPASNVFCHRKVAHYKSCPGTRLPDNILLYFISMDAANTQPSDWAKEGWQWLVDAKIIDPAASNPQEPASKEWIATVLFRLNNHKF